MLSEAPSLVRAFVAISLPAELREKLSILQRDLQTNLPSGTVRWTRPDHIHLTLKFLGNVAAESLRDLEGALQRACQATRPLPLRAEGVGCFPEIKRPQIVWVGIGGARSELQALQLSIESETARWCEPEVRAFRPHLTLGRVKHAQGSAARALAQALTAKSGAVVGAWLAEEVELIRSELSSEGPRYSRLSIQALAASSH